MIIYQLRILRTEWSVEDSQLYTQLTASEKTKVSGFRRTRDKKLALYSIFLVKYGYQQYYSREAIFPEIIKNSQGKPYFKHHKSPYFNVSHSENMVICGFSSNEIGVDTECIKEVYPEIIPRTFHREERRRMPQDKQSRRQFFYLVWTRKEAFVKWEGTGISQNLTAINTVAVDTANNFHSWQEDGYQFSVYTAIPNVSIHIEQVNVEELYRDFLSDLNSL